MNLTRQLLQGRQQKAELIISDGQKDWTCTRCRFQNGFSHWNNRKQSPVAICRLCGSNRDESEVMSITSDNDKVPPEESIVLDQRIVQEWDDLLRDIEHSPTNNHCHGEGFWIVDSCPIIQKFFLMMKYYHIHIGKTVVDMDDAAKYQIDSMTNLVEGLQDLSLIALINMFEHISTKHRDPQTFDHFIDNIGPCSGGVQCSPLSQDRGRRFMSGTHKDTQRPKHMRDEERMDVVERHTLSFFRKWHSFLFHPKFENNAGASSLIGAEENENKETESGSKYIDYRFGVWIDYTVNTPFFDSMKEEMMENEIYSMTADQWQTTLMKALTHLDSDKIRKYTAKQTDEKYGIVEGQDIGIENVVAILIYCNYTDLQSRFSETFRGMQDDDTDEMIVKRHCHNFYWLGRYDSVMCFLKNARLSTSKINSFRALFVAIHFYGDRMSPKTVVWHGVSHRMLFENFATFFECPTSTSIERLVAQGFSGSDGVILKLKSKFKNSCSVMLDVSAFSNYPAESERLFVKETLIITDVMMRIDNEWTMFGVYFEALVYFEVCLVIEATF